MSQTDQQHITIEDNGRPLASADVEPSIGSDTVRASMHVESGHLPSGTRTRLVDAVVDRATALQAGRLQASLPAGDGEILDRLRERCVDLDARAAGASCLVDAPLAEKETWSDP
jgi:hypothetical protein